MVDFKFNDKEVAKLGGEVIYKNLVKPGITKVIDEKKEELEKGESVSISLLMESKFVDEVAKKIRGDMGLFGYAIEVRKFLLDKPQITIRKRQPQKPQEDGSCAC